MILTWDVAVQWNHSVAPLITSIGMSRSLVYASTS